MRRALAERPAGLWFVLFLFVNLAFDLGGGTNASSRFAALAAMAEDHSFRIDRYSGWTADWAKTPDGGTYSNKAPGPVLFAFPLYWVVDKTVTYGLPDRSARDQARKRIQFTALKILAFLLQVIPYFWLTAAFLVWLRERDVSPRARHLAALLMLFGNSAAVFLNSYFGHGMAAAFVLALAFAWVKRWPLVVGLAFGGAVLCDYATALLLLPLVWVIREDKHRLSVGDWSLIALGGLMPFLLWVGYHAACFGGPFALPMKFQNPNFVDVPKGIYGVLHWAPDPKVLWQLVAGGSRGLLWTNPWLLPLAVAMFLLWRRHTPWADVNSEPRVALGNLAFGGLFLMWLLNGAFGAWQGGQTVGPRYLVAVLPLFGPIAALAYDRLTGPMRAWLWTTVAMAAALSVFIFLSNAVPDPGTALWPYFLGKLFAGPSLTAILRTGLLVSGGVVAVIVSLRQWRRADLDRL